MEEDKHGEEYTQRGVTPGKGLHGEEYTRKRVTRGDKSRMERSYTWRVSYAQR